MNILKLYPKLTISERKWIVDWMNPVWGASDGAYWPHDWPSKSTLTLSSLPLLSSDDLHSLLRKNNFCHDNNIETNNRILKKFEKVYGTKRSHSNENNNSRHQEFAEPSV